MYAIENIAIRQDREYFAKAAGATTHYIDTGIDTGPIIHTVNIEDPFGFASIWELKAASFQLAFNLLVRTALELLAGPHIPVGSHPDIHRRGPNFQSKSFTLEARQKAVEGYLRMKALSTANNG